MQNPFEFAASIMNKDSKWLKTLQTAHSTFQISLFLAIGWLSLFLFSVGRQILTLHIMNVARQLPMSMYTLKKSFAKFRCGQRWREPNGVGVGKFLLPRRLVLRHPLSASEFGAFRHGFFTVYDHNKQICCLLFVFVKVAKRFPCTFIIMWQANLLSLSASRTYVVYC